VKIRENRILFPKKPTGRPAKKSLFLSCKTTSTGFPASLIMCSLLKGRMRYGYFGLAGVYFPKPSALVAELIRQVTNNEDIILIRSQEAGQRGHAVLALNKQGNGNRKFVLIEMDVNICQSVTVPRLMRVIQGTRRRSATRKTRRSRG